MQKLKDVHLPYPQTQPAKPDHQHHSLFKSTVPPLPQACTHEAGALHKARLSKLGRGQSKMGFPSSLPRGAYPTALAPTDLSGCSRNCRMSGRKRIRVSLESLPWLIPYPYLYSPRQSVFSNAKVCLKKNSK